MVGTAPSSESKKELLLSEGALRDILHSAGPNGVDATRLCDDIFNKHRKGSKGKQPKFKLTYGMSFRAWLESLPHIAVIKKRKGKDCLVMPAESSSKSPPKKSGYVPIKAKTENQERLMKALNSTAQYIIVEGPAGTGKTSLGCSYVAELKIKRLVDRIVVTRPTVTAEEDIGHLPGSLQDKLRPFLMPLFDSFTEAGFDVDEMIKCGEIEVVPLAFMRGRTFKNSFIIADEMQNATPGQMKMILTRLGENSRMFITGDINQSDLYGREPDRSGLSDIIKKAELMDISDQSEYMKIIRFDQHDILRNEAVGWLLKTLYQIL